MQRSDDSADNYILDQRYEKKSDACYRAIRQLIVDVELEPGAFIDKGELCSRLSVSRQPVTAALARLEREGLVEILPQRGSYVARLSLSQLTENLALRAALESYAVRKFARKVSPEAIDGLRAILHAQERAVAEGDRPGFVRNDAEFHRRIAQSSVSQKFAEQIDIGLAAMIRTGLIVGEDHWAPIAITQHRAIVDALAEADCVGAADRMVEHVEGFAGLLTAAAARNSQIFIP